MSQFKAGDVVRLKSGGPELTVLGLSMDADRRGWIGFAWFDAAGEYRTASAPEAALTLATTPQSPLSDPTLPAGRGRGKTG